MRRCMIVTTILFFVVSVFFGGWMITYPSTADPKNLGYVLWKAGIYRMNLDKVTEAMVGDGDPEKNKIVIGKTESELRKEFGYLVVPSQASPYLKRCYQTSYWKDQSVLFIRNSQWMVVFRDGKASDLILIKGC